MRILNRRVRFQRVEYHNLLFADLCGLNGSSVIVVQHIWPSSSVLHLRDSLLDFTVSVVFRTSRLHILFCVCSWALSAHKRIRYSAERFISGTEAN